MVPHKNNSTIKFAYIANSFDFLSEFIQPYYVYRYFCFSLNILYKYISVQFQLILRDVKVKALIYK